MKKKWYLGMVSLLALATLASCGEDDNASSSSTTNDEIYAVYEAYKANGGTQSYDEWLASIKGEKGDKGDKGDTGAQGEKGDKGDKGDPGEDGQDGSDGKDGVNGKDGADGADGKDGQDGKDGTQIYTGNGAPSSSLGVTGDLYLDVDTGDLYTKANSWIKTGNVKGKDGADGKDGENGKDGADGSEGVTPHIGENGNWWIGETDTGVKAAGSDGGAGADGDTPYIGTNGNWWVGDTDTQVKAKGADGQDGSDGKSAYEIWLEAGNTGTEEDFLKSLKGSDGKDGATGATGATGAKGEQGQQGEKGDAGKDGSSVLTGSGAPDNADGNNGDSYIDTSTFDYYVKADGQWTKSGNLKGSKGDAGSQGEKGDKGEKGDAAVTYVPCIFNNWDGTKLYEFYFEKGTSAVYGGATPTKEDTIVDGQTCGWVFKGWDKPLENITQPTIFTAQFRSSLMTVTFLNYDGAELEKKAVTYGGTPTYTGATPTKPDTVDGSTTITWTFKGWDKSLAPIYDDTTYTAVFDSPNAIKCTFVNEDGTELGASYCGIGGKAVYEGETPTKADANNGGVITRYTFSGWDKTVTNMQESTTFTARYDESIYYVCTFVDWDGTELKQVTVAQNGTANYGSTPRKDPVADGSDVTEYTFNSWDKATSGITAPMTFKAVYTSKTYEGYIVTFNDVGGDVIAKAPVATGATAVYPENPKDLVDKYYSYDSENVTMFVGWDSSLENITSAKTVTAKTKTISRHKNGEYPQTKVTDSAITAQLNGLTSADAQGYYEYGGEKYAKVNGYWRKVEPIKWRYLRNTSTGVAEFISEKILTTHVWNSSTSDYEDGAHANNYAKSDIRKWLNGDFMDQVFYYDRSLVQSVTVDNSALTTMSSTNEYACGNTTDYIYLPSYQDVKNKAYGFSSDADRIAYDTDGNADYWWTRSPIPYGSYYASFVGSDGFADDGDYVHYGGGVRPSLQLLVA